MGERFLNERLSPQTFAGAVANVCRGGCKRLRERLHILAWRMQCTAWTVALHCRGGCSALRLRRAKGAQKSPVLFWTREKGWRDTPHAGHCSPQEISAELIFPLSHPLSLIYLVSQIHDGCGVGRRERIPSAKDEAASAGGSQGFLYHLKSGPLY